MTIHDVLFIKIGNICIKISGTFVKMCKYYYILLYNNIYLITDNNVPYIDKLVTKTRMCSM